MPDLKGTLCWDCAKAIGDCRWSLYLKPIKGWTATPTKHTTGAASFLVTDCPEFKRDAINCGLKRYGSDESRIKKILEEEF